MLLEQMKIIKDEKYIHGHPRVSLEAVESLLLVLRQPIIYIFLLISYILNQNGLLISAQLCAYTISYPIMGKPLLSLITITLNCYNQRWVNNRLRSTRWPKKKGHHLQLQSNVTRSKNNLFECFKNQKKRGTKVKDYSFLLGWDNTASGFYDFGTRPY